MQILSLDEIEFENRIHRLKINFGSPEVISFISKEIQMS